MQDEWYVYVLPQNQNSLGFVSDQDSWLKRNAKKHAAHSKFQRQICI